MGYVYVGAGAFVAGGIVTYFYAQKTINEYKALAAESKAAFDKAIAAFRKKV